MRNPDLPPGMKPHDSDPVEQKPLGGVVSVNVRLSATCRIYGIGPGWGCYPSDEVFTHARAAELARDQIVKMFGANPRFRLDDIDVDAEGFEPD